MSDPTPTYDTPTYDTPTYNTLLFEVREQVATVTLNRPEVRNAFGAGMGDELDDALRRCDQDDDIRAVVLTGTPPAFCSGADLARGGETFGKVDTSTFNAAGLRFPPWDVRKPVIGAINGHAIGVGMTLTIQCDLRFMAADAKYGVVQTQRGVMGDAYVHWSLPRIVGIANAAEILLTGKTFDGHDMQRLGVANRVLPADDVLPTAWEYAREMAATTAPLSVAFSKRALWASFDLDRDDVNHLETVLHHHLMGSADAREGVMAFLERRTPQWKGSVANDWPETWPGEEVPGDEGDEA